MRTPHTAVKKGKRVIVRLKTGERFIDKFMDRKGNYVIFENHKVVKGNIKSFGIFKGNETDTTQDRDQS